jgi:hypothetical protein
MCKDREIARQNQSEDMYLGVLALEPRSQVVFEQTHRALVVVVLNRSMS